MQTRLTAGLLLGRTVDGAVVDELVQAAGRVGQVLGDGRRERGLAVVDVANGADVHVGLVAVELGLGHGAGWGRGGANKRQV